MAHNGYIVYKNAQAEQLDQARLILMMFAGSINYLNKAIIVAQSDLKEMTKLVSKTKNVLLELIASLNLEQSGDMGEILLRTYRGLFIKLNVAYIENDIDQIKEVRDSLVELEDAWKKVFQSPEYQDFKRDRNQFYNKQQLGMGR
jgi:flagellar secretion chaperone FliS